MRNQSPSKLWVGLSRHRRDLLGVMPLTSLACLEEPEQQCAPLSIREDYFSPATLSTKRVELERSGSILEIEDDSSGSDEESQPRNVVEDRDRIVLSTEQPLLSRSPRRHSAPIVSAQGGSGMRIY